MRFSMIAFALMIGLGLAGCSEDVERKNLGEPCDYNTDCADEICHHGTCCNKNPLPNGKSCKIDAQCRSFNCSSGACAAGTRAADEECLHGEECLSGKCVLAGSSTGTCAGGGTPDGGQPDAAVPDARPDTAVPDAQPDMAAPDSTPDVKVDVASDTAASDVTPDIGPLKKANDPCTSNSQCESGSCHKSICAAKTQLALGATCSGNGDCLSYVCTAGKCAAGAGAYNTPCLNKEECSSSKCTSGKCEPHCGNNIKEGTELCDGADMSKSCSNYSKLSGLPECKKDCTGFLYGGCYTLHTPNGNLVSQQSSIAMWPNVAFDGTYFLVVWRLSSSIGAARIDQSGKLVDTTSLNLGAGSEPPAVACGTDHCLVTWRGSNGDVKGRRVDTKAGAALGSGPFTVGTPMVSTVTYNAVSTSVSFNGANYLVTWPDGRNASDDIYGARVTPAGVGLDKATNGFPIAKMAGDQIYQWAATDGTDWLVTWYDVSAKAAYATWVKGNSLVVNPAGTKLPTPAGKPLRSSSFRVTRGKGKYLVTYTLSKGEIYALHVTTSGTSVTVVGGKSFPVLTTDPYVQDPLAAWDGAHYIVTYYSSKNARLVRLAEDGTTWPLINLGTASYYLRPAAVWGSKDFLTVWGYGVGSTYKVFNSLFR